MQAQNAVCFSNPSDACYMFPQQHCPGLSLTARTVLRRLTDVSKRYIKMNIPLCLIKHLALNVYEGMEVQLHVFLTSALDEGEWSASRPGRFTLAPSIGHVRGWMGLRAGLDATETRNISCPCLESNLDSSVVQFQCEYLSPCAFCIPVG
jgi:hypothetical protein